jgi:hypothetical protein
MMTEVDHHTIEAADDGFLCSCGRDYPIASKANRHAREANARIERNAAAIDTEPATAEASPLSIMAQAPDGPVAQAEPGPVAAMTDVVEATYTVIKKDGGYAKGEARTYAVSIPGVDEPVGKAVRVRTEGEDGKTVDSWKVTVGKRSATGKFRNKVLSALLAAEGR